MEAVPQPPYTLSATIVLYHNPPELLHRTVTSLYRAAVKARDAGLLREVHLSLVDNSCNVSYRDALSKEAGDFPQDVFFRIDYFPAPENRGFGAGQNRGLQGVESDMHLVLNPDVELDTGALQAGLAHLHRDPGIALLSPRVFAGDGRQEFLCKRYPTVFVLLLRAFAPAFVRNRFRARLDHYEMVDVCTAECPAEVPLASGCFMLSPTAVLRAIEGFDERYFLYFEDFDLSLRLATQGRLVYDPAMRIVHHGGYAARKGMRHIQYFIASGIRFFSTYGWRWI